MTAKALEIAPHRVRSGSLRLGGISHRVALRGRSSELVRDAGSPPAIIGLALSPRRNPCGIAKGQDIRSFGMARFLLLACLWVTAWFTCHDLEPEPEFGTGAERARRGVPRRAWVRAGGTEAGKPGQPHPELAHICRTEPGAGV